MLKILALTLLSAGSLFGAKSHLFQSSTTVPSVACTTADPQELHHGVSLLAGAVVTPATSNGPGLMTPLGDVIQNSGPYRYIVIQHGWSENVSNHDTMFFEDVDVYTGQTLVTHEYARLLIDAKGTCTPSWDTQPWGQRYPA